MILRAQNWREDRVWFHDVADRLRSLPADWTSAVAEDPFNVVCRSDVEPAVARLDRSTHPLLRIHGGAAGAAGLRFCGRPQNRALRISALRRLRSSSRLDGARPRQAWKPDWGDAEHPADYRQWVGHEFGNNKGVLHRVSRAKYAAAFFRMLTSILARDSSARKRVISACSRLTARRPAAAVIWPASYCFSHCCISLGNTSNLRPHSAKLRFSAFL